MVSLRLNHRSFKSSKSGMAIVQTRGSRSIHWNSWTHHKLAQAGCSLLLHLETIDAADGADLDGNLARLLLPTIDIGDDDHKYMSMPFGL